MFDLLIQNARIYDGSGKPPFPGDIGVTGGIISQIGPSLPSPARRTIDAAGRCVTPGFIDMHSHADLSIVQYPDAESLLGQGITTVFCGHCGMGMAPVGPYWKSQNDDLFAMDDILPFASVSSYPGMTPACETEKLRPAYRKRFGVEMDWTTFRSYQEKLTRMGVGVNLAMEVGLQQIRQQTLGLTCNRPADRQEILRMEELVQEAMEAGAFGLSIGYDYTPDMYAGEEELLRLAALVKQYDGIVSAHTRNGKSGCPDWQGIDGIREFLALGQKTGVRVHISHIQPGFRAPLLDQSLQDESARRTLEVLDEYRNQGVRVTWDALHPDASSIYYFPELCSFLTYYIMECGGKSRFREKLTEPSYRSFLAGQIRQGNHILFPRFPKDRPITRCQNPQALGKTVENLAEDSGCSPEEQVLQIIMKDMDTCIRPLRAFEQAPGSELFWRREDAVIGTDNCAFPYDYEGRPKDLPAFRSTPEAYGGIVHFLKRSQDLPMEQTIRKLTGNAAALLGLRDRGLLKPGFCADLVMLDPERLDPCYGEIDPRQKPAGLDYVIVNGKIAVDHQVHTHVRSGRILSRPA
ncbi:amidohydrolase family protein [Cuneatibacter sp. NSJ-177]|uniref:N-acyl-D-amino-acid deacylase family protein n=1 Tax=Cuneatibacter sp. NSJ-177 TaxID=2931401 RepID=UPI001FD064E7|nr:amidohydrolase family protein [Cuneatibacter sp. NSJ-177]MCJ7837508.1 amidohydrolase family protein [Cuneatibacter sp. NSJ-177]